MEPACRLDEQPRPRLATAAAVVADFVVGVEVALRVLAVVRVAGTGLLVADEAARITAVNVTTGDGVGGVAVEFDARLVAGIVLVASPGAVVGG